MRIPRTLRRVRVTDLEVPEERYIAFSLEAALPKDRHGYALALAHNSAVQLGKTTYEPLPDEDEQEDC